MFENYIKVACASPEIKVGDCMYNAEKILENIKTSANNKISILCLPELCITGYTCGDLFLNKTLLNSAWKALNFLIEHSKEKEIITICGLPFEIFGKTFNAAGVFSKGKLLGIVPKTNIPNYGEFYEKRYFSPAFEKNEYLNINNKKIPFGTKIIFHVNETNNCKFAIEICEDLWIPDSPSIMHSKIGANIIINLSASNEVIGKSEHRRTQVKSQSLRLVCAYVYNSAGIGESTTDMVFLGHNIISENGHIINESKFPKDSFISSEIDLSAINFERRRINTFKFDPNIKKDYDTILCNLNQTLITLSRKIDPHPFIPSNSEKMIERCEEILNMLALSLEKRLKYLSCETVVVGVSGGLDSTLALLIIIKTFESLKLNLNGIKAITMPCFGTTKNTKNNILKLCKILGVSCLEIDITEEVKIQLKNINQSIENHSTVFENAQARIRTLTLMNIANKENGIVVGTGDLSEISLGWSTYNGDHMSMYNINSGVPKTLIRHLVMHISKEKQNISDVLSDICKTPISPELLPPESEKITQNTEEIIGPYELHDFFLYHILRWGRTPSEIFYLATHSFKDVYSEELVLKWLRVFYKRFFANQFKRNAMPDGPKIGTIALSPRGDFRMPSDAACNIWIEELENIKTKIE
ncbi:MAG: NAD(+) synthase [Clostridiales bacterium]|jgi:NAD+ synthase (glutamine-hydrolysing)|nr:NAD(+) synthase [Clostridiales bacterium]